MLATDASSGWNSPIAAEPRLGRARSFHVKYEQALIQRLGARQIRGDTEGAGGHGGLALPTGWAAAPPVLGASLEHVLVSACLLGSPVRYDGSHKRSTSDVLPRWLTEGRVVAVWPEVAGGLPVPRPPTEIAGGAGGAAVLAGLARVVDPAAKRPDHGLRLWSPAGARTGPCRIGVATHTRSRCRPADSRGAQHTPHRSSGTYDVPHSAVALRVRPDM